MFREGKLVGQVKFGLNRFLEPLRLSAITVGHLQSTNLIDCIASDTK